MIDRSIITIVTAGVAFCGFAGGSTTAVVFGALALAALRLDAHAAFVSRHRQALGVPLAFLAIAGASAARAGIVSAAAFLVGRTLGAPA